ncbi:hypothetical protein Ddc_05941 [Ditylenchus destructor]|nr:hypothetical protein Ddc_05941 [Ditylenchus destructor]
MHHVSLLAFTIVILQLSQRIAGFEFDLAPGKSTNFAPGNSINQFSGSNFAEDEDNAGFTSGSTGGSSGGGSGIGGTRRLIQPPPLKRSSAFESSRSEPISNWMHNPRFILFQRPSVNYYYLAKI